MTVQVFRKDTEELRTTIHNVTKITQNDIGEFLLLKESGVEMNLGKGLYRLKVVTD